MPEPLVTEALVDFVATLDPAKIAEHPSLVARTALADTVGVMIAGSRAPASVLARRALDLDGGAVAVAGTTARTGLLDGAMCNGLASHALDFDDTLQGLTSHPSSHIVPALLALAERYPVDGRLLVASHLVGLEVESRLARALNPPHYKSGWHATGTLGSVAAAAACAKLLGLTRDQIRHTLGAACSSASGLRANFGSMVKGLHAGHAARAGVEAAILARAGFDSVANPFEHQFGMFRAMNGPPPEASADLWDAGSMRELECVGRLAFKPYPCCGEATAAVEAAIPLAEPGGAGGVDRVEIRIGPFAREILAFDRPTGPDEARFSATYCVATALATGRLTLADFEPAAVAGDEITALVARCEVVVDDTLGSEQAALIRVTRGSATAERGVTLPAGHPSVGFGESALRAKFLACAEGTLAPAQAERLLGLLLEIDTRAGGSDRTAEIAALLVPAG